MAADETKFFIPVWVDKDKSVALYEATLNPKTKQISKIASEPSQPITDTQEIERLRKEAGGKIYERDEFNDLRDKALNPPIKPKYPGNEEGLNDDQKKKLHQELAVYDNSLTGFLKAIISFLTHGVTEMGVQNRTVTPQEAASVPAPPKEPTSTEPQRNTYRANEYHVDTDGQKLREAAKENQNQLHGTRKKITERDEKIELAVAVKGDSEGDLKIYSVTYDSKTNKYTQNGNPDIIRKDDDEGRWEEMLKLQKKAPISQAAFDTFLKTEKPEVPSPNDPNKTYYENQAAYHDAMLQHTRNMTSYNKQQAAFLSAAVTKAEDPSLSVPNLSAEDKGQIARLSNMRKNVAHDIRPDVVDAQIETHAGERERYGAMQRNGRQESLAYQMQGKTPEERYAIEEKRVPGFNKWLDEQISKNKTRDYFTSTGGSEWGGSDGRLAKMQAANKRDREELDRDPADRVPARVREIASKWNARMKGLYKDIGGDAYKGKEGSYSSDLHNTSREPGKRFEIADAAADKFINDKYFCEKEGSTLYINRLPRGTRVSIDQDGILNLESKDGFGVRGKINLEDQGIHKIQFGEKALQQMGKRGESAMRSIPQSRPSSNERNQGQSGESYNAVNQGTAARAKNAVGSDIAQQSPTQISRSDYNNLNSGFHGGNGPGTPTRQA